MEKYNVEGITVEGITEEIPELTAEDIELLKETLGEFVETLGKALETLSDSICVAIETLYQIPHKSRGFPASYEGEIADEIIEENGERLIVQHWDNVRGNE